MTLGREISHKGIFNLHYTVCCKQLAYEVVIWAAGEAGWRGQGPRVEQLVGDDGLTGAQDDAAGQPLVNAPCLSDAPLSSFLVALTQSMIWCIPAHKRWL